MNSKLNYIKECENDIKDMVSTNTPLLEIARKINVKYDTLKKYLKELNIDYSGNQSRKGLPHTSSRKDASEYFNNNKYICASKMRKILIRDGYKEEECERCGLSEWMGQPIPLELHHMDGNHYNNNFENLQILCSNCHMQVHGYSNVSNIKKIPNKVDIKKCPICGEEFIPKEKDQIYCSPKCYHTSTRKQINQEEIDNLLGLFKKYGSFEGVGRNLNITGNAIKKRCKHLNLPTHIKDIMKLT